MSQNSFNEAVSTMFKGMDGIMSTKTVVGEPIHVDDTIIIPLADVSFGMGAGSFEREKNDTGGGGIGGKVQPVAVLVISDGTTKMVSLKNNDGVSKVLDMVPDIMNKVTSGFGKKKEKDGEEETDAAEE